MSFFLYINRWKRQNQLDSFKVTIAASICESRVHVNREICNDKLGERCLTTLTWWFKQILGIEFLDSVDSMNELVPETFSRKVVMLGKLVSKLVEDLTSMETDGILDTWLTRIYSSLLNYLDDFNINSCIMVNSSCPIAIFPRCILLILFFDRDSLIGLVLFMWRKRKQASP